MLNPSTTYKDLLSASLTDQAFAAIGEVLRLKTGFNISAYKNKCMKRRIAIRIRATSSATAEEYCDLICTDHLELERLKRVLTIHVSQFFRNPSTFQKLKDDILPALFAEARQEGHPLRIWSVGCAGGEEPYTLALILKEHFAEYVADTSFCIVATDVDEDILKLGRGGIYPVERLVELPEGLLEKYFYQHEGKYHLCDEIKSMVEFRHEDLNSSTGFPSCDLILCRNVLIYFERPDQERIMLAFADALSPRGILVLGKSEILVGETRRRFDTLCPYERIYLKSGEASPPTIRF